MTPDQQRISELERQVTELTLFVQSLQNAGQLHPLVAQTIALKAAGNSSKTAASATRSVNESGAATYSVMYPPSGFILIGGKNVPYIN